MAETEVKLEGVMSIAKVEGLHKELEEAFRNSLKTTINAKEVERVDTSVLQTLSSFIHQMSAGGVEVSWGDVSDEFVAAAKLIGLESALNL